MLCMLDQLRARRVGVVDSRTGRGQREGDIAGDESPTLRYSRAPIEPIAYSMVLAMVISSKGRILLFSSVFTGE